jgi:hypothetical protein
LGQAVASRACERWEGRWIGRTPRPVKKNSPATQAVNDEAATRWWATGYALRTR